MSDDDNNSEFLDGAEYDCEFGSYEPERPFYQALAREADGPCIELACGTGRIAIPLARLGYDVTGIDLAPGMLTQARRKSDGLSVVWHLGDCRNFDLGRRFSLAYLTGNAFQAFLRDSDQHAMLATVRRHLRPGGRIAFETRNPRAEDLWGHEAETYWHSYRDPQGRKVDVTLEERYDAGLQILDCLVRRYWAGTNEPPRSSRIRIRYTDAAAIDRLLEAEGFAVERRFGNFDGSRWTPSAERIVTVARR